ncbi:MAG: bestrophin family ion channel [Rhodanobacteraceae bacterium]
MLIDDPGNVWKLAKVTGAKFMALFAVAAVVGLAANRSGVQSHLFPGPVVGVFVAAVGIFLAFRINAGYSRWWLARQVWGGLVNESRSLGLYVASLMRQGAAPTEAERELARRIVFRHIGYINALRLQLRREGDAAWEAEIWGRRIDGRPLFADSEAAALKSSANVATQIGVLQGADVSAYFGHSGDYRQVALHGILRELYIRQGQCEAIKNTVLAWGYVAYTKLLTRLLAGIVILSQLNGVSAAGTVLVSLIATAFITIEQVGRNLDNPFEGGFNDTPMSSLCRTIEIDLLQQIGLPTDLKPRAPTEGRLD